MKEISRAEELMQTAEGGSSQWKHVQVKELEERKMGNNSSGKLGWLALGLWKGWAVCQD